jgi:hypothetical protein
VNVRMHRASEKTQMMRALVRVFGPDFVLKTVAASEYADRDKYAGQPDAAAMSEEEHRHAGSCRRWRIAEAPDSLAAVRFQRRNRGIGRYRRLTICARPCLARTMGSCRICA